MHHRVTVIDSHTGGEPTRVVVAGGPDLPAGHLHELREHFRTRCDDFRAGVVREPRGSDVLVGALLVPPAEPGCVAGAIFFNNVGVLQMCGHGTIGLAVTLAHLGRISPGVHRLDTSVGVVGFELHADGCTVTVENVPSYREVADYGVEVPGVGHVTGDIAWGGNWFFLAPTPLPLDLAHAAALTDYATRVMVALHAAGHTEIDHVELVGPPADPANHARNFVLCPGHAYDRSPCGTGTSAKLACLAADGKLAEGAEWRQESAIGSVFLGCYRRVGDKVIPSITGSAFVTAEATLLFDSADPFRHGIRA